MQLELSAGDLAFREEVREFLNTHLDDDIIAESRRTTAIRSDVGIAKRWSRALARKGWLCYAWPKQQGGAEFSVVERYIFETECMLAGAPTYNNVGPRMIGPILMKYGSDAQKQHYLPRIINDEDAWCQGYSEPGSGSDLASLQMSAVADGEDYVLNGSKIWTTAAHTSNRMFCLVRTSSEGRPQEGITFLLLDMDSPGVSVRPIVMFSGDHELNQVFFDNVRVPRTNRVGAENEGWSVAKYLLEYERGGTPYSPVVKAALARVREIARAEPDGGAALLDDADFRHELARLEVENAAAEMTEKRLMSTLSQGGNPGDFASMIKVIGSELWQRALELGMRAMGHYALPYERDAYQPGSNVAPVAPAHGLVASLRYFNLRAATIYAGSSEVQRTILAKQVLGL